MFEIPWLKFTWDSLPPLPSHAPCQGFPLPVLVLCLVSSINGCKNVEAHSLLHDRNASELLWQTFLIGKYAKPKIFNSPKGQLCVQSRGRWGGERSAKKFYQTTTGAVKKKKNLTKPQAQMLSPLESQINHGRQIKSELYMPAYRWVEIDIVYILCIYPI